MYLLSKGDNVTNCFGTTWFILIGATCSLRGVLALALEYYLAFLAFFRYFYSTFFALTDSDHLHPWTVCWVVNTIASRTQHTALHTSVKHACHSCPTTDIYQISRRRAYEFEFWIFYFPRTSPGRARRKTFNYGVLDNSACHISRRWPLALHPDDSETERWARFSPATLRKDDTTYDTYYKYW